MGKLKNSIAIIGEGITEFYYIRSLVDKYPGIGIKPDHPKHTSMMELSKKIVECINEGYRYVMCLVDMDTKANDSESLIFSKLKSKYNNTVSNPKKGILCDIFFYETHLCTELFFLYYFDYTSKYFINQEKLIDELNKRCHYEKTEKFFRQCKGLHPYFEKNGGNLKLACVRAQQSVEEKETQPRDYTYSELGKMMAKLDDIYEKDGRRP